MHAIQWSLHRQPGSLHRVAPERKSKENKTLHGVVPGISSEKFAMCVSIHICFSKNVQSVPRNAGFAGCDAQCHYVCYAGMEQPLELLLVVVQQVQTVVHACQMDEQWAKHAQQLQQKLQALQATVASADAGAGRSVLTCHLQHQCEHMCLISPPIK